MAEAPLEPREPTETPEDVAAAEAVLNGHVSTSPASAPTAPVSPPPTDHAVDEMPAIPVTTPASTNGTAADVTPADDNELVDAALAEAEEGYPPDPTERHAHLAHVARWTQISAVAVVALLLLAVLGVQLAEGDQIRSGVTAFGVDLGGMTKDEATAALNDAVAQQSRQTLRLTDGDTDWSLSKSDLGVRVDVAGVVDDAFAEGRSGWGASRLALLWHVRSGDTSVGQARIAVDPAVLDEELATIQSEVDQPKIEAELTILSDATVHFVPSQVGRVLDVDASRGAILGALAGGESSQMIVVTETDPLRPDTVYTDARAKLQNILDAPIEIVATDQVWTMTPDQIAYWLDVVQPQNGRPAQVRINEQWVYDIVDEIAWSTDRQPKSARVWWDGGGVLTMTQPGVNGQTLDQARSEPVIMDAFVGNSTSNRVELPVAVNNMTSLPTDLSTLGINTVVAEASTPYGGSLPSRMHNIELAASRLNGTLIMPGQQFSFNAEVGSTSTDAGFQVAYGIDTTAGNITTVPSVGGGICQVATTVFQPVFWAGYDVQERNTHAYWIPRYETNGYKGLDATVDEASGLDFKWTNNTSTAVLLEASTNGEYFTVRLYGTTPNWRVEVDPPVYTNEKPADTATHYEPTYDLPAGSTREVEHSEDGFDSSVIRRVISGDQVSQMEFIGHYLPARNVVLVGTEDGSLPAEYAAVDDPEYVEEPSEYVESPEETDDSSEATDDSSSDEETNGALEEPTPSE